LEDHAQGFPRQIVHGPARDFKPPRGFKQFSMSPVDRSAMDKRSLFTTHLVVLGFFVLVPGGVGDPHREFQGLTIKIALGVMDESLRQVHAKAVRGAAHQEEGGHQFV